MAPDEHRRRVKVCHLIPLDGIGGVEAAARSMAEAEHLDCDFKLILLSGESMARNRRRIDESVFRSPNNPFAHLLALVKILLIRPEVLICSLWRTVPVGVVCKIFRPKMKLVCFLHASIAVHWLDDFLSKVMVRCSDAIWSDSPTTLSDRAMPAGRKAKRTISFVLAKSKGGAADNVLSANFVFWGRLHHQKGLDRAVGLMAELKKRGCIASLQIWGPDYFGEKEKLSELVASANVAEIVRFMGPAAASDLATIASRNSFFLQLSRWEGAAIAVMEAMQLGLVPIVTPVGDMARYCRNGENAVVVEDPQDYDGLCTQILTILNDAANYRRMQLSAKALWEDAPVYCEDVCLAVRELVGER